jgi:hypothetical protein
MTFAKRKSYGPKISLTEKQEQWFESEAQKYGLDCICENSWTGSAYIHLYENTDQCQETVAKIRMSGHERGVDWNGCHDEQFDIQGGKSFCLENAKRIFVREAIRHTEEKKARQ